MTTLSAGKCLDGLERIELDLIYRFLTLYIFTLKIAISKFIYQNVSS